MKKHKEQKEFEESMGKSFVIGDLILICGRCEIVLFAQQFRVHGKNETVQCHGCGKHYSIIISEEEVENEDEENER